MTAIALTIAGSDSSGGAGIQADLKTFSALGVYGASVLTALTAQNTLGVQAVHEVPPEFVTAQLDSVLGDLAVNAAKIGMLANAGVIRAVAEGLDRHHLPFVVLDPVMVATSGDPLLAPDAVAAMRALMLPRVNLVTPNLPEAAALLGVPAARDDSEMRAQADELCRRGAAAVLIKGGHGGGAEAVDWLRDAEGFMKLAAPRTSTANTHGTGCTLSAAIAAGLAQGQPLRKAVSAAKGYVSGAIAAADRLAIGHGHGPTHHFFRWW